MSKRKKNKLNIKTATDSEIIQKIEEKWGEEITYIAPLVEDERGKVYTCLDLGDEAVLIVGCDGWVTVKANKATFVDVLGVI